MPKHPKYPKLNADQLHDMIKEYDIHFDGPVSSSEWPLPHVQTFQSVRDVDRVRYEEYGPDEKRGLLAVAQMKERVHKLIRTGTNCRKQRENESTWRNHTEPH